MSDDLFLSKIVAETLSGHQSDQVDQTIHFDDAHFRIKTTLSKLPIFYIIGEQQAKSVIRFNAKGLILDIPTNWSWWMRVSYQWPFVGHLGEHEDHLLKALSSLTNFLPTTLFYARNGKNHYIILFNTKEDAELESYLFEIFQERQRTEKKAV